MCWLENSFGRLEPKADELVSGVTCGKGAGLVQPTGTVLQQLSRLGQTTDPTAERGYSAALWSPLFFTRRLGNEKMLSRLERD